MTPIEKSEIKNPEETRFKFEVKMEKLRFYQRFFLPTGSGIIALMFTYESLSTDVLLLSVLIGTAFLGYLYFRRHGILKKINKLIEN